MSIKNLTVSGDWLLLYNGSDCDYHITRPGKSKFGDEYFNDNIYNNLNDF